MTYINSLWPSDAIWRQKTESTLAPVMACCLTAPSHYLHQCWLIISKVWWHSSEGNFTPDISAINHCNQLEKYSSKISIKSPRPQWVNNLVPDCLQVISNNHVHLLRRVWTHCCYFLYIWTLFIWWVCNMMMTIYNALRGWMIISGDVTAITFFLLLISSGQTNN